MLFHTFVAYFLILVIFIVKPIFLFWQFSTFIGNWIFNVSLISLWTRWLFSFFVSCEIEFLTYANGNFFNPTIFWFWWVSIQILDWNLMSQPHLMLWYMKPLIFAYYICWILEWFVVFWDFVEGCWWRWFALEISCSFWKPTQIGSTLKAPIWLRYFLRVAYFFTQQGWQIVVTSSRAVQKAA